MNSPANQLVTVFGGSGFIGRHVVRALAKRGYRVRVACRRPDLAFFLQPLGNVGQIHAMQANLRYPDSVAAAVQGADAIVNLVGILTEGGKQRFDAVQAEGAAAIARAAKAAGITRFVQMSAIGADAASDSVYAQTKAAGEKAVLDVIPSAVILRPSIVFGPEDQFFNRFASLARIAPALPLVGGGGTKFQPVFVGDVAEAVALGVDGALKGGTIYELGGPQVSSFRDLLAFVCETTGRKRALVPLPFGVARIQAGVMEALKYATFGLLPEEFLLTRDQVTLLEKDNVVSDAAQKEGRTLEGMGITPDTYETVVPTYLYRFRKTGQFDTARA
ncbi:complex I NDUFA9 subunit family protein [Rhizobiales bacterium TNE-4]|nr:complex I NDUFA9 subunit family protein [Rhizobiales bacterium TNE-4]MBV1826128.1 complex I NDUFA9 subunit family protein [Rhizobiales bacterium TNE-4]